MNFNRLSIRNDKFSFYDFLCVIISKWQSLPWIFEKYKSILFFLEERFWFIIHYYCLLENFSQLKLHYCLPVPGVGSKDFCCRKFVFFKRIFLKGKGEDFHFFFHFTEYKLDLFIHTAAGDEVIHLMRCVHSVVREEWTAARGF